MSNYLLLKKDLKEKRELINITIDRFLPRKDDYPKEIHKAMRHTLFAGGKRFRPYLVIRTFNLFNDDTETVLPVAAAIELMHTYTLIHDDLPEIDNDDMRRGKKACHVLFGPDIALLAGDALLTETFRMINAANTSNQARVQMVRETAEAAGDNGLIAGQMMDIIYEGKETNKRIVDFIHLNKTAKLIQLCVRLGAIAAGASEKDLERLTKYGEKIGLAFQITDDILDVEGNAKKMGKTIGKDEKVKKATYPAIIGLEKSKEIAQKLIKEAKVLISQYGSKADVLVELTDYLLTRDS